MKTIYLVRHQHRGVIPTHAFSKPPTPAQVLPLAERANKDYREGWSRIVEAELLDDEVPDLAPDAGIASTQTENIAEKPKFVASGTGAVSEAPAPTPAKGVLGTGVVMGQKPK